MQWNYPVSGRSLVAGAPQLETSRLIAQCSFCCGTIYLWLSGLLATFTEKRASQSCFVYGMFWIRIPSWSRLYWLAVPWFISRLTELRYKHKMDHEMLLYIMNHPTIRRHSRDVASSTPHPFTAKCRLQSLLSTAVCLVICGELYSDTRYSLLHGNLRPYLRAVPKANISVTEVLELGNLIVLPNIAKVSSSHRVNQTEQSHSWSSCLFRLSLQPST
jgi:hypothetical protein